MYKCVSIISKESFIYPGDLLIKVKISEEQARKLVHAMEQMRRDRWPVREHAQITEIRPKQCLCVGRNPQQDGSND